MTPAAASTTATPARRPERLPLRRGRPQIAGGDDLRLTFDRKGGPLVAVAGLAGGAGTSTLTYLIAAGAARQSAASILAADLGGPTAGLAIYAGVRSRLSLPAAADRLAAGLPVTGLFAVGPHGVRVMSAGPGYDEDGDPAARAKLIRDARCAHGLTAIDCGTLTRPAERQVLDAATHILWVLPATTSGVLRARELLDVAPVRDASELVVARGCGSEHKAPAGELADLADQRGARLVLLAHVDDPREHGLAGALDGAAPALQAIGSVISR